MRNKTMSSTKPEIRKQNTRMVRVGTLLCGLLLALNTVALAQSEGRSRTRGTATPRTRSSDNFHTGVIETAYGPRKVSYQILKAAESGLAEDLALFEGDIILTNIDNV